MQDPRPGTRKTERDPGFQIRISPEAKTRMVALLKGQPSGSAFRIYVLPGTAPRLGMALEKARRPEEILPCDGVPLLIDPVSRRYLADATVDYASDGGREGFRIDGPNVPATRQEAEPSGEMAPPGGDRPAAPDGRTPAAPPKTLLDRALRKIFDPEIPMNIVDLGLIYGVDWADNGNVRIRMSMTSAGCPVTGLLQEQVKAAAEAIPGIRSAEVTIVWDPPWSPERMSDFAKRQFGFL